MKEKIESFIELYESSPSLVLFENLLDFDHKKEKEFSAILELGEQEKLNPVDIVLESLVNIISEEISRREVTHSEDKVLINRDIRNMAVEKILKFFGNNKTKLRKMHQLWLGALKVFLNNLYEKRKNLKIDEVIFLVGSRFRISALSAIRAIASIA